MTVPVLAGDERRPAPGQAARRLAQRPGGLRVPGSRSGLPGTRRKADRRLHSRPSRSGAGGAQRGFLADAARRHDSLRVHDRLRPAPLRPGSISPWSSSPIPCRAPGPTSCPPRCSRSSTTGCSPGRAMGCARRRASSTTRRSGCRPRTTTQLIDDPTGYLLRTYLPRTVGAFAGFSKLSSFLDLTTFASVSGHMSGWASPEMIESFKALGDAAREVEEWTRVVTPAVDRIQAAGLSPVPRRHDRGAFRHPGRHAAGHEGAGDRHVPAPGEGVGGLRASRAARHRLGDQVAGASWPLHSSSSPFTRAPTAS